MKNKVFFLCLLPITIFAQTPCIQKDFEDDIQRLEEKQAAIKDDVQQVMSKIFSLLTKSLSNNDVDKKTQSLGEFQPFIEDYCIKIIHPIQEESCKIRDQIHNNNQLSCIEKEKLLCRLNCLGIDMHIFDILRNRFSTDLVYCIHQLTDLEFLNILLNHILYAIEKQTVR